MESVYRTESGIKKIEFLEVGFNYEKKIYYTKTRPILYIDPKLVKVKNWTFVIEFPLKAKIENIKNKKHLIPDPEKELKALLIPIGIVLEKSNSFLLLKINNYYNLIITEKENIITLKYQCTEIIRV